MMRRGSEKRKNNNKHGKKFSNLDVDFVYYAIVEHVYHQRNKK